MALIMSCLFIHVILDFCLTQVKHLNLENRLLAKNGPLAYFCRMSKEDFRERLNQALKERGWSKAELSRKSGVPYHALDKYLKGTNSRTSAENAKALADTLGITLDGEASFDELRQLFFSLSPAQQQYALASLRGIASEPQE